MTDVVARPPAARHAGTGATAESRCSRLGTPRTSSGRAARRRVTVVAAVVVAAVFYRAVRFVFVTGRWDIVRTNLTLFMVGRYPRDQLWRVSLSLCCLAVYGGVLAGFVHRRQLAAGPPAPS